MVGSDENFPEIIRHKSSQGEQRAGKGKMNAGMGQSRRALSTINQNMIGAPPYPYVIQKRDAFIEKNVPNKLPPIPVHDPLTRKFAAQMGTKKQLLLLHPLIHETKPTVHSVANASQQDKCITIDMENDTLCGDYPVPMSVQHTEALLKEIDQMDADVEMEDHALVESVLDIDLYDKKNPLAVVDFIDDIYAFYRRAEIHSCVPPDYMAQQYDINEKMRGILIDWLTEVHYKFELMDETLYLTVNLIDRFLAVEPVVRKKLQLVGVTAMLLACKYEEISVPVVEDFILISDKAYNRKEVLEMESLMVNKLQFNMSVPTPYVFMRRFLKAAQSDKKLELLSFFMIELCLIEYEMLKFPPSLLAAAAIFTANCSLRGIKVWNKTCEKHTSYTENQLLECSKLMVSFHQKAGTGKLTGVYRKYSTSKYGFTANSEPALFLLH